MKHPPYHLRTNKAIDRLLLADVLSTLKPDNRFTYYSLAGPFLEDLRVMDHYFPDMRLVSLESNNHTYKRQAFHQFSSRIELKNRTLSDFLIHDYEPGNIDVFWLDYTDLQYQRFSEFQVVLKKVPIGSIVRITLRAEPEVDFDPLKGRVPDEVITATQEKLQATFEDEFAKVLPHPTPNAFGTPKEFARTVQLMVRRAASTALDTGGSNRDFLHLQSTRYNDNTQMLSVTGMVCLRNDLEAMRRQFQSIRFADFDWSLDPFEINIPALSLKECLHLERLLPISPDRDAGDVLAPAFDYWIAASSRANKQQLSNYADHHREYPRFIRLLG